MTVYVKSWTTSAVIPALLLAGLVLSDLLLSFPAAMPYARTIGDVLWCLASGYLVYLAVRTLAMHWQKCQRIGTTVVAAAFLYYFLSQCINPQHSHFEATQELACMLRLISGQLWAGFNDLCHIGYPARQFLLPSVPTLLFGVHQWALNVGHAAYLIIGVVLFTHGAVSLFERRCIGEFLGLSALLLLAHAYYFLWLTTNFEQAIYPVSFALMATGLVMSLGRGSVVLLMFDLGLVGYFAVFSYTPSLSLVGLILLFIVWCGVRPFADRSTRAASAYVTLVLVLALYASVQHRLDIRLGRGNTSSNEYWDRLGEVPGLLTGWGTPPHFISYYLAGFFLFVGLTTLVSYIRRIKHFRAMRLHVGSSWPSAEFVFWLVTVWALCVICLAVMVHGYADPPPLLAIHRATLVIPVLLAASLYQLSLWHWEGKAKLVAVVVFCIGAAFGAERYHAMWHSLRDDNAHFLMLKWINDRGLLFGSQWPVHIHFSESLKERFQSLHDQALYYLPNLDYEFETADAMQVGNASRWGVNFWVSPTPVRKCGDGGQILKPSASLPINREVLLIYERCD